jgi:BMFP domain-containing protein YqiC
VLCLPKKDECNQFDTSIFTQAARLRPMPRAPGRRKRLGASHAGGARIVEAGARSKRQAFMTGRQAMLNARTLDELAARIGKALEGSPVKDIEKNVKAMLQSGLSRLDLVTRQEFDVQAEVLRKTRDKVERLEARVAELEARMPPPLTPA